MEDNSRQNYEKKHINSNGTRFYNSEKETAFKSCLVTGYYDETVSLRISPALPEDQISAKKKFDYDKKISTILDFSSTVTLISEIKDILFKAYEDKVTKSVGIPIGATGDAILTVAYNSDLDVYKLGMFTGINAETKKPTEFMMYEFKKKLVVRNYSPESGDFEPTMVQGEFKAFVGFLEEALASMTNAVSHSIRYSDRFFRDKLVGGNGGSYNRGSRQGGSIFNAPNGDISNPSTNDYVPGGSDNPYGGADEATYGGLSDIEKYIQ